MVEHHTHDGRVWRRRMFDLTVPRVCPDCNHHWMSDIEAQASSLALPLVRGESKSSLTPSEQRRLAVWCFLKVITLEIGRPSDQTQTYPDMIYTGFYRFKEPPTSTCVISIGRRPLDPADPKPLYVWFKSQGQKPTLSMVGPTEGYRTLLVLGHLAIDVLGVLDPRVSLHTEPDERLAQIWPVAAPAINLPAVSFSGVENDDLV